MSMSIAMAAGMNALVGINSQLQDLQAQALSGKKINSASDGLSSYLSAQTYSDRASRLTSINSTLSQNLGTIKAASTGLSSISKTVNDALDQLKTASQTQAQVVGTGGGFSTTGDTSTQAAMTFTGVTAAGAANNVAINGNSTFVNANGTGIAIGGQKLTQGNIYSFSVNGKTNYVRIAGANDPLNGTGDGSSAANAVNVTTISALMNSIQGMNTSGAQSNSPGYINVSAPVAGAANSLIYNMTVNNVMNTDGTTNTSLGMAAVSYAAGALTNNVTNMMTAGRAAVQPNATYSIDYQTNGGTAGNAGQSVSYSGQKNVYTAGTGAVAADTKRAAAASAYKLALTAIDQYLKDASVSGINLLNGDSLLATFNEKGTSSTIQLTTTAGGAASYGSVGLGLVNANGAQDYANNFAVNVDTADAAGNPLTGLQAAINKLTAAQTTIQLGVAQVGQFQNTIQTRSDFNLSIISLLNDSANNLTAADMTQVSTQTAARQVQQSFAQAILSATKQSDQSMLQLLR